MDEEFGPHCRLIAVHLDEGSIGRGNSDQEHERAVAAYDLIEENVFAPVGSLTPLRRVVRDYFTICDSYYDAIRTATPSQIETIDMARRGLHNEGSELLRERLAGKIALDLPTARRLFTLISALYWKG
jgi:uncharacterized protein (UPF0262 family)